MNKYKITRRFVTELIAEIEADNIIAAQQMADVLPPDAWKRVAHPETFRAEEIGEPPPLGVQAEERIETDEALS